MLFDCCRGQADAAAGDAVPMDLSMRSKGGKGKKGKGEKATKTKRTKTKTRKAKVRTTSNPSTVLDTVFNAKVGDT